MQGHWALAAFVLAKTLPLQFTPWSNYYPAKTIWFCDQIVKTRGIKLLKIDTSEELGLGDIFTKGLAKTFLVTLQEIYGMVNFVKSVIKSEC